jgi:hypothetical protein
MEFAITVPDTFLELMTPGCLVAPGVFVFYFRLDFGDGCNGWELT